MIRGLVINRWGHDGINTENLSVTTGIRIEGNFIGTDPSGTVDLGNARGMLIEDTTNATIGGVTPDARNLISGNGFAGISISTPSSEFKVEGNLIGTKKDGVKPLGNGEDGVELFNASRNTVGGPAAGAANIIAFNGGDGVQVTNSSTGDTVMGNPIFSNGDQGIDLGTSGPTANDTVDPDTGANNLQNNPVMTSARSSGRATTIKGTLNSTPNRLVTIEIFSNPRGGDEGKKFLGRTVVATDSGGDASFVLKKKVRGATGTATATMVATGDTSEFFAQKKVLQR